MAGTWERRGTVTVTQDSNIVTGVGTSWTDAQNGPQVGNTFYGPDGQAHEVAVIRSATELWLADDYKGVTATGVPYQIDTTRVDSVPGLASRVAAVLGFAQGQYDNLDKWTQGGVDEDVTLTSPNGESVTVPSLPKMGKDYTAIGNALPAAERAEAAADRVDGKHAVVVSLAAQVSSDASATQSAKNTAVSASTNAQSSATSAAGNAAKAEAAAVKAEQAAQTVVGALIDAGPYNASTGVLPTPVMSGSTKRSSIWKVTGNGTAGGIELGVGDSLVYTARDNSYYKIDNTESVSKVNDKSGVVVLNAADVGAAPADVVAASALPFPDVWIPLNDSLRMLAGFGDEIKVGDYTVATQANLTRNSDATVINKSGKLVNATINEARFEREGLLVEDKSTNTHKYRDFTGPQFAKTRCELSDGGVAHGIHWSKMTATDGGTTCYVYLKGGFSQTFELGRTYTYSVCFKIVNNPRFGIVAHGDSFPSGTAVEYNTETGTLTKEGGVLSAEVQSFGEYYKISITATCVKAGGSRSHLIWQTNFSVGDSWLVADPQIESLPFFTSYIPTSGADVTRAADKLTIPRLNNECVEWYSGADPITPILTTDTIELVPPAGKRHLRNVKGFFTPLTEKQKAALK